MRIPISITKWVWDAGTRQVFLISAEKYRKDIFCDHSKRNWRIFPHRKKEI